jgi:hypothetical protein
MTLTCYPNPFSNLTTIKYTIPVIGDIRVEIFDVSGRSVKILVNERKQAGTYQLDWITDLPPGFYECRLSAGNLTKHISLVKNR